MPPIAITRYALRALAGPPLVLTLVVSILAMIGSAAGWVGLALDAILVTWVWTYTYMLIDYTAHGRPIPVLDRSLWALTLASRHATTGLGWACDGWNSGIG